MEYVDYRFIYPPRPDIALKVADLNSYDEKKEYLAQPKLNGSRCLIFLNKNQVIVKNRHNENFTYFKIPLKSLPALYSGNGWMCLDGEYMNKNKMNEKGMPFNIRLVFFDVLIYGGEYLIGKTFEERFDILEKIFHISPYNPYLNKIDGMDENLFYTVKKFDSGFVNLYREFENYGNYVTSMYEGLVIKKRDAKLEPGNGVINNNKTQFKFRREDNLKP